MIKIKQSFITGNKDTIIRNTSCDKHSKIELEIGEYKTIKPIPYSVLEETLKNLISNWNQKQKEK